MKRTPGHRSWVAAGAGLLAVAAVMAGPPWAFLRWRETRLVALSTPEVQADWDAFRAQMRRESGRDGPVQRKVPKSAEPPELVWLRRYLTEHRELELLREENDRLKKALEALTRKP